MTTTTFLTQTITDVGGIIPGDCWRTSIACLLGRDDPTSVPHFITGDDWWQRTVDYVGEHTGRTLLLLEPVFPTYLAPEFAPPHVVATGPSPRGDWLHAVIVSAVTGELVWDPHPSRAGLAGPIVDVAAICR